MKRNVFPNPHVGADLLSKRGQPQASQRRELAGSLSQRVHACLDAAPTQRSLSSMTPPQHNVLFAHWLAAACVWREDLHQRGG